MVILIIPPKMKTTELEQLIMVLKRKPDIGGGLELRQRHVYIEGGCALCNNADESVEHVCSESLSEDLFSLLLWGIWSIWKERNKRVWQDKWSSPEQVRHGIYSQQVLFKSVGLSQRRVGSRVTKPWSPPPVGWLKANMDGAFDKNSCSGGIGVIVRDSDGLIVGGCCCKVGRVLSPALVEALAARRACQLAVSNSLAPIIFESDCQKLVRDIMFEEEDASGYGGIVEDVIFLHASLPGSYFTHVYRESNFAAHMLAKLALSSSFDVSWSGHIPSSLSNYVATHCMN
ncbi:uncharacterized protein LOC133730728 [Rosa rugosa]|uniref:uncharacterized protein LOC133730728 n=1 Tax=Rosa rugosa TaxID=74645 RepID=UPI002B407FCD|nr:uncharacterized protein LOC133730728 [Rosa rugosa]